MLYRIFLITFVFSALIQPSAAQTGYFQTTLVKDGDDFSFPIFSDGDGKKASTRINRLLQLSELYRLVRRPYSARIFDQSKANDGSIYGGKVSLVGTIYSNNGRILSIGFDQTACGATCGYWNNYYNFNSGNGDRIDLRDLFTSDGYQAFFKAIVEKRSVKYRREVKKKVEAQFQEAYLDTLGCFENDDLSDFYIRKQAIVIDGYNCLVKGQKVDGLDMTAVFELSAFRRHLNSYGKAIFGLERSDISRFRSTELPQLFEGAVNGTLPIVMVLGPRFESSYAGFYAYLKYGEGISLKGSEKNNSIELTEYVLSPTVTNDERGEIRKAQKNGYITGNLTGRTFEGTWSDATKTKQLGFSATIR